MSTNVRRDTSPEQILRFNTAERMMHWSIAVPFMICYTTALILVVFYNPDPSRPYREVFSWMHRISGVALMSFPLLSALGNFRAYRTHLNNIKEAWLWTFADIKWLMLMGLAAISKKIQLPEEGKFNAGEKLNFMAVMTTYPLFGLTGFAIWATSGAGMPWLIHFVLAGLVTPLMFGHIFMATINPGSRKGLSGMITGFVEREWASHHYRQWFREEFDPAGRRLDGEEPEHPDRDKLPEAAKPRRRVWLERLAMFFVGLLLPLLFLLAGLVARSGDDAEKYISARQPLRSQAAARAEPVPGGELTIGARITVAKAGPEWTMVTDKRGRAGYVESKTVATERPHYKPELSGFPDCHATEATCETVARSHLDDCRLDCRHTDDPHCSEKCEDRYYECVEACEGGAGGGAAPTP